MKLYILLCFFCLPFQGLLAQLSVEAVQANQKYRVTMVNGEQYEGQVIRDDDIALVLQTKYAKILLKAENIESVNLVGYKGSLDFPNLHHNRYYLFTPSKSIGHFEGYYQNIYLVGNIFGVGISKHLTITGGFEIVNLIMGTPVGYLNSRLGFSIGKSSNSFAGGIIVVNNADNDTYVVPYASLTLGSNDASVSFALGLYNDLEDNLNTAINVSGIQRISQKLSLVSENYIFPNNRTVDRTDNALSVFGLHGIRIFKRKNSYDIGVATLFEDRVFFRNRFVAFPYLSYSRVF